MHISFVKPPFNPQWEAYSTNSGLNGSLKELKLVGSSMLLKASSPFFIVPSVNTIDYSAV